MDQNEMGAAVRVLREGKGMTQAQLADKLCVSAKTISKWETGHGFPDITMLEPLSEALGISAIELFSGAAVRNGNRAANMLRAPIYVCPVCGNTVFASGGAVVSCCGITLAPQAAEECDEAHAIRVEKQDGEYYVTLDHPMTKQHHLLFLAAVSDSDLQVRRLYPEGPAEAYFRMNGVRALYAFCNRDGLFKMKMSRR